MPRSAACSSILEMPAPAANEIRLRALERLYLRRDAVDALIRSLEEYQDEVNALAPCVPINAAARKCS